LKEQRTEEKYFQDNLNWYQNKLTFFDNVIIPSLDLTNAIDYEYNKNFIVTEKTKVENLLASLRDQLNDV
jgi:hypothetical protein